MRTVLSVCQSHWTSITSGFFCILGTAEHEQHQCWKKKQQQTLMVQLGARSVLKKKKKIRNRRHESGMKTNRDSPPPSWWSWCGCGCCCCKRRCPGCLSPSARRKPSACPPFSFSFLVSSPLTLPGFNLLASSQIMLLHSRRYFSACCRCERCVLVRVCVCVAMLAGCSCADAGAHAGPAHPRCDVTLSTSLWPTTLFTAYSVPEIT